MKLGATNRRTIYGDRQTCKHANMQTCRQINTMTRPGLGARASENMNGWGNISLCDTKYPLSHQILCFFKQIVKQGKMDTFHRAIL